MSFVALSRSTRYGLLSPYFAPWAQYGLLSPYFALWAQYGLIATAMCSPLLAACAHTPPQLRACPVGASRYANALFRPSGSIRAHSYGYVLAAIGGLRAYASAAPRLPRWGKPLRKRPKRRSSFDFVRNGEIAQNSTVCPSRNGHITAQIGNIAHFHQRHFQP